MVPREVEQKIIVEHRERPGELLPGGHGVGAGLQDVRVVEREAFQPGAAAGEGQEKFAVADGEVGLEFFDERGEPAQDAGGIGDAPADLAEHGVTRTLCPGGGRCAEREPRTRASGGPRGPSASGTRPPPTNWEFVLGHQALDDGLRTHDVAVGVAHHAVEDASHEAGRMKAESRR